MDPVGHLSDDLLELYLLGRLGAHELAVDEEHVLLCPTCQDRPEETDVYVRAMQGALQTLQGL